MWEINISFNPMDKATFAPVWSFLNKQKGKHEAFTIILPGHDTALGAIDGTPTYTSKTNDN